MRGMRRWLSDMKPPLFSSQDLELILRHLGSLDVSLPPPPSPPRPTWLLPPPVAHYRAQIEGHLIQQRRLPPALLEPLFDDGSLYADSRASAVFLLRDQNRQPVADELRGTLRSSPWRGMAPGSRKDLGFFAIPTHPGDVCVLCESSIDAINCHALHPR